MPAISESPTVEWATIRQAAEIKQLSTKTVRRYISQGIILAERVGPKLIRVNLASLDSLGTPLQYPAGDHE